jgi:hypothetical protein
VCTRLLGLKCGVSKVRCTRFTTLFVLLLGRSSSRLGGQSFEWTWCWIEVELTDLYATSVLELLKRLSGLSRFINHTVIHSVAHQNKLWKSASLFRGRIEIQ